MNIPYFCFFFLANPFLAIVFCRPILANVGWPFLTNPFLTNPFLTNPFLAKPHVCCCVCCCVVVLLCVVLLCCCVLCVVVVCCCCVLLLLCVGVVCWCCVLVLDPPVPPMAGPPCAGPSCAGPPYARPPEISRFFSLLRPHFRSCCLSLGVFSLNFGGVRTGPSNVHVWSSLDRRPKAGDAPHEDLLKVERRGFRFRVWAAGVSHDNPRTPNVNLTPPVLQTPPKFHERTPKREKKERKLWQER